MDKLIYEEREALLKQKREEQLAHRFSFDQRAPTPETGQFLQPRAGTDPTAFISTAIQEHQRKLTTYADMEQSFGQEVEMEQKDRYAGLFFDPYAQKMLYGIMDVNEAMIQAAGMSHAMGLSGRNTRNTYLRSAMIMNEALRKRLGGVFVEEYERDKGDIEEYRNKGFRNYEAWVPDLKEGISTPLLGNIFGSSVEDAFYDRPSLVPGEPEEAGEVILKYLI